MMPIVDGLEQEFEGRMVVAGLNLAVPANQEFQQQLGVRGHPSFVVLDAGGRVVEQYVGQQSADTLRTAMMAALEG
jgi:thioredoxin-like negative regulator of GroEL